MLTTNPLVKKAEIQALIYENFTDRGVAFYERWAVVQHIHSS